MATDRQVKLQAELNRLIYEKRAIDAEIATTLEGTLERARAQVDLNQTLAQITDRQLQLDIERGRVSASQVARSRQRLQNLGQEEQNLKRILELENQRANLAKETAGTLIRLSGINGSLQERFIANVIRSRDVVGSLTNVANELDQEFSNVEGRSRALASSLIKVGEVGRSISNTVVEATKRLFFAQDEAYSAFARLTGQTGALRSEMIGLERSMFRFGITLQDATQAQSALFSVVTQFTTMTARQRNELAQTTALLQRFGVGAETTAKNVQIMTTMLGMGGREAAGFNTQLFTFAQQAGISTTKVANDFAALGPQLAVFGDRAGNVFMRLEMAAKQSGFAIERLQGLAMGFNRFDTAADSVGRLNAILGGPFLSTIQMVMTTDPAARMQMLSDAVNRAGKSFEMLTYYERLSLTEGLKLQNVGELALLMRGQFELLNQSVMKTGDDFEALARQEREYNTVLDEYRQLVRATAAEILPLVRGLSGLLSFLSENTMAFKAITVATLSAVTAFKSFALVLPFFAAGAGTAAAGTVALGAGLSVAAIAAAALFGAFTKSGSPKFYEMPYYMAGGFNAMANGAASASQGIGMLGASVQGVSQAMSELPDVKVAQFKTIMSETRRVTEEVSSAGAGPASLAIGVARAASAASAGGSGMGGGGTNITVPISLDGEVISKRIFRGLKPI
jgi:hypothetical protein